MKNLSLFSPFSLVRDRAELFPQVKAVKESNTIAAVLALVRREGILGWLSGVSCVFLMRCSSVQGHLVRQHVQGKVGLSPWSHEPGLLGCKDVL